MILEIIDFIYYKIYRFMLKASKSASPETGATCMFASVIFLYLLAIVIKITIFRDNPIKISKGIVQIFALVIGFLIYYPIYVYFEKTKRFVILEEKFKMQTSTQKFWGGVGVLVFSIGSLVAIALVIVMARGR